MVAVLHGMSNAQVDSEIRAIRKAGEKVAANRETARAFLLKHDFITKSGKLTAKYSRK